MTLSQIADQSRSRRRHRTSATIGDVVSIDENAPVSSSVDDTAPVIASDASDETDESSRVAYR